jgi:hypothetical protein
VESTWRTKPRILWNHPLSTIVPTLFVIPLTAAVTFTILIIGARFVGASLPIPPDPFAAYADVFPGQPRSAVTAFGFSCPESYFNPDAVPLPVETCVFWPTTGPFSQVVVSLSQDVIHHLKFVMRGNTLRLGDLNAMWGFPLIEDRRYVRRYHWNIDGKHASTIIVIEQHSISSPMDVISNLSFSLEA